EQRKLRREPWNEQERRIRSEREERGHTDDARAGRAAQKRQKQPVSDETRAGPDANAERSHGRGLPCAVDQVERDEAVKAVDQEISSLKDEQQAHDLPAANRGERLPDGASERRRHLGPGGREPQRGERERKRR